MTAASGLSEPHSLFWQPGTGQQHQQPIYEDQDEEYESSDDEDVFAYLPPASAGSHASSEPAPIPAYVPPPTTANSLQPPPSRFATGKQSLQSIPEDEDAVAPGTTSSDVHVGAAVGGDAYRMSRMGLSTQGSTDTSSREVHVSLPSRGSEIPEFKRISSDMGSSVVDGPDFENLKHHHYGDAESDVDEDSPFPEVRASVSNIDDVTMPAMTFRMWTLGMLLCIVASGANIFFNFRQPSPQIVPLVLLLISYPAGKLMAYSLPIRIIKFPRWLGGLEFSLNPGPFNMKEHVLIYIMANVSIVPAYGLTAIVVAEVFYDMKRGFWFALVLVLATQLTGFGLAGLCRRFLVWPASMIWPQNLVACTLLNTLHAEDDKLSGGITRFRFFMIAFVGTFFFFFLPGYIFTALSTFSWVCWIRPKNIVVNQLFGVQSGLGLGLLTFDWSQITWIGSPLMVPWWAELHVFTGFVIFYVIACPILYYTNVWNMSYFPMLSNIPYDKFGKQYDIDRVLGPDHKLNATAYENYSNLYMPAGWVMTYFLAFAVSTSVIVHTALYHGQSMLNGIKNMRVEKDDIHAKLMRSYPEVPDWWYAVVFVVFFALAIVAVEHWDTGVPVWALLLALIIAILYTLPGGFIFALTGQTITLNQVAQIIPGTLLPGNAFANMIFKVYAIQTQIEAINFVQDLKLGHYIKVPPRATFIVQSTATIIASFVQVSVKTWIFNNVENICNPHQPDSFTCPHNQVFYTASMIWGLIGPGRQFGKGSIYHPELYALAFGAVLPVPFWLWQRKYPQSRVKYVSIPVIVNGVSQIPPATGINYSSWFIVAFVFQYLVRRRRFAWWSKYNYVLSAALDSGTVVAILVIFFCLQFPKGINQPQWWGTTVFKNTADWQRLPLRQAPPEGLTD
ncbi:OPT-domain-containing protein [Auricularia subglabra TFB-10046 SS5]|nr:OPT-domain-containing protein [Auricularia subglabra TFB-10046 SS5]